MICGKAQGYIIKMQKRGITAKEKAAIRYALRRHVILGCKACKDVYKNSRIMRARKIKR